jgi:ATP adenylyltransferase
MSMDKLWAPWRINYVQAKKKPGCIFCAHARSAHLVFATEHSLCLLNIFPYNNGHVMIAPRRHVADLAELKDNEVLDLFGAVKTVEKLLKQLLRPQGFNIGINLGEAGGAGIPGHLHIHIVPRWKGDTNFMPVLNNTKVISQSLQELLKRLKDAYRKTVPSV